MFGAAAGRHPPRCSHGDWLDRSWWFDFDLWRMMMVHSPVYVRPLEVAFLGHGAWSSGRKLGCMHIYSLVLGGPGIVLLDHETWWIGTGHMDSSLKYFNNLSSLTKLSMSSTFLPVRVILWTEFLLWLDGYKQPRYSKVSAAATVYSLQTQSSSKNSYLSQW